MPETITIHLARHGESTWNAEGRVQGQQEAPLSDAGRRQAGELAVLLAGVPIRSVIASDLARASETAQTVAGHLGLPVTLDHGLRERHFGVAEQRLHAELAAEFEGEEPWWTDIDFAFEFGESQRDHYERVSAWLTRLLNDPPADEILLVSHGGTVRVARAFLTGRPVEQLDRDPIGNCAVTTLTVDPLATVLGARSQTVFREVRSDDLPGVLRLLGQLNPDDPKLQDDSADEIFRTIIATPGLTLFVIEERGTVIATAYLNVIPNLTRSGSPYAIIENVVVDASHRGTGIGKRLMAGVLHAAWSAGCYKAMLGTGSRNPATHAFYRACGFDDQDKTAYVARPQRRLRRVPSGDLSQAGLTR